MNYSVVVQSIKDGMPVCVRYFSTYEEAQFYAEFMETLTMSRSFILWYDSETGVFYN